jgi:HPt (histidine-containing phosphotransfer) domain-containing protein
LSKTGLSHPLLLEIYFVNHYRAWLPEHCWPGGRAGSSSEAIVVPLDLDWIGFMPSPPLAPDDGPIDIGHLGRMTLDDGSLQRQVLAMFLAQTDSLIGALAGLPADAAALAHKLKGSARAIGAFGLADAAQRLEAAILNGADPSRPLRDLTDAVALARSAVEAILRGP